MSLIWDEIESPAGPVVIAAGAGGLRHVHFGREIVQPEWTREPAALAEPARQLAEYFAGRRRTFDLRLAPGGTEFDRLTWAALQSIPAGETISYAELARRVGKPGAARAVGRANGRNPLAVVIPCHRVIGSDGTLGGYAGGLAIKRLLLAIERGS